MRRDRALGLAHQQKPGAKRHAHQVSPGRTNPRRRGGRNRHFQASVQGRCRRNPCRHGQVRGACFPRPGAHDDQQLAFTQALGDIEHAIGTSLRSDNDSACRRRLPTSPTSTRTTSRSRSMTGAGCSPSATASGTPTARSRSYRRSTRCCTHTRIPVQGRQHRVRRHASRLRRARPGNEGSGRGPRLRAFADLLARQARLHRFHRRRARALQARAPAPRAHTPVTGASRSSCPRTPARSSAGRCPRRKRSSWT